MYIPNIDSIMLNHMFVQNPSSFYTTTINIIIWYVLKQKSLVNNNFRLVAL